jgi:acetyl esterase
MIRNCFQEPGLALRHHRTELCLAAWTILLLSTLQISAQVIRDVEYAAPDGRSLKLDVNVPAGSGPFPIAIIVHGGGNKGDKQSFVTPLFGPLSAASFTWFTIDFRPSSAGFAAAIADVDQAIRWIKLNAAKYKGDPRRVALIGESSGGILALVTAGRATQETRVNAVVAFYTPADLSYIVRDGNVPKLVRDYWGISPDQDLAAWQKEWSPISYARRGMSPVLLIHGSADTKVPFANSLKLEKALKEAGVPCELIAIKDGDHGMGSWETVDSSYKNKMIVWLKKLFRH